MLTQAFGPMWARRLFERFLPWYDRDRETVKDAHTEQIRRRSIFLRRDVAEPILARYSRAEQARRKR